jgi:hypothetical protein
MSAVKRIDTNYHFIRECVKRGQIVVNRVSTVKQKANSLTKALPAVKLVVMTDETLAWCS